ncbi:MAG: hypothetical protein P8182_13050, partial [Deltaproteobacteria bacterium]
MQYFGEFKDETIHSMMRAPRRDVSDSFLSNRKFATLRKTEFEHVLTFATDRGVTLAESDLQDQFIVFQFSTEVNGPTILDMSEVNPVK